jgi:hypothetical protein
MFEGNAMRVIVFSGLLVGFVRIEDKNEPMWVSWICSWGRFSRVVQGVTVHRNNCSSWKPKRLLPHTLGKQSIAHTMKEES